MSSPHDSRNGRALYFNGLRKEGVKALCARLNTSRADSNRTIKPAHVIEELIKRTRETREACSCAEPLGLTDDELAAYDTLGKNESAREILSDMYLRLIAREVAETVRNYMTID